MSALQDQTFEFGDFVLVPQDRLLLCRGEPVPLTAKAFDLLVCLVRRSGHLVTKDELFAEIWPNTTVQETNLTVNMSALRKALERGSKGSGIIQTVSGRGYRFMPSVVARGTAPGSVAVLPFVSDSSDNNYLADGLTDATTNGLVQLRSLRVAPRTSASQYKGSAVKPKDAGRALDVATVVTATVSQHSSSLRIQLDLVDVARDAQIWGARYQGDASDLLHLQTRILQDLARALRVPVFDQETRRLARTPTENSDAYRAYLQGRYEWNQRSEAALKRGIERFRHAVAIDPHFAAAYSGLADSYSVLGYLSYLSPAESFPAARDHANKALELDPSLAEAHASLGFVKLYYEWDWPGAEAAFQRAISLDPTQAASHHWYSIYLLTAGRPAEALQEIQLAQQRDPLSLPVNTDLGFCYYYSGRYDEAVKQLNHVLGMNPEFPPAHLWLGRTYQELTRFDEALAAFRRVEDRIRDWAVSIAARGFVAGVSGRPAQALEALAELKELSVRRFVTSYGVALVHAGLGQNDDAIAWLNKAFDERSNWLVWLRLDPRWSGLRPDPRFAHLISRMQFPGG